MYKPLGGSDGFRDFFTKESGPGLMNPETIAGITHALVKSQTGGEGGSLVVIGMDNRPENLPLEQASMAGARAAGAEIIRLGVAPTPAVLKTAHILGADAAVILTASHNSEEYGGWKGTFGSDKPYGDEVKEIDSRYWEQVENGLVLPVTVAEDIPFSTEFIRGYINNVVANISQEFGENPLAGRIFVTDTANGAAMDVTPYVLERLGATVERFACDGLGPINEGCGATDLNGVKDYLLARPDLVTDPRFMGVLLNDGDGDRMIGMGARIENGKMLFNSLDGNRVIELLAEDQEGVVATEYANDGSKKRVTSKGIAYDLCANSDVEVTHALRELQRQGKNRSRGGEFTGHHVDLSWLSSGDGVRMAAWVAAYATKNMTSLYELSRRMPLWPEKMRKLQVKSSMGSAALAAAKDAMKITRDEQNEGLRFVVRESGTEKDAMRIWGVGRDEDMVNRRTQEIKDQMLPFAA